MDDDTEKPYWGKLKQVDLTRLVTIIKDPVGAPRGEGFDMGRYDDLMGELHSTQFDTHDKNLPLWKLLLIPNGVQVMAIFVTHHAGCDGLSVLAFHDGLYSALNTPQFQYHDVTELIAMDFVDVPDMPLLPPMEEYLDCKPRPFTLIKILLEASSLTLLAEP